MVKHTIRRTTAIIFCLIVGNVVAAPTISDVIIQGPGDLIRLFLVDKQEMLVAARDNKRALGDDNACVDCLANLKNSSHGLRWLYVNLPTRMLRINVSPVFINPECFYNGVVRNLGHGKNIDIKYFSFSDVISQKYAVLLRPIVAQSRSLRVGDISLSMLVTGLQLSRADAIINLDLDFHPCNWSNAELDVFINYLKSRSQSLKTIALSGINGIGEDVLQKNLPIMTFPALEVIKIFGADNPLELVSAIASRTCGTLQKICYTQSVLFEENDGCAVGYSAYNFAKQFNKQYSNKANILSSLKELWRNYTLCSVVIDSSMVDNVEAAKIITMLPAYTLFTIHNVDVNKIPGWNTIAHFGDVVMQLDQATIDNNNALQLCKQPFKGNIAIKAIQQEII